LSTGWQASISSGQKAPGLHIGGIVDACWYPNGNTSRLHPRGKHVLFDAQ
jgi:hypothetical protein